MLLLLLAIYRMRMRVWVMEDAIHVRFWPLIGHKIIPLCDIEKLEAVEYRPIAEYGGWGLRGVGKDRAFNVSGNKGVRFWFKDDTKLLIGSQNADTFADSVRVAMR
ncbi:hypothetical protein BMS3Bbin04_00326 [bacterium BMS3Bbin04]|nr:hypothetical protein BMS3Bbin04_00326 [bacterium BMS3Bbin04]